MRGKSAMAAERRVKRFILDDKHICNGEIGPRGLTYDETSLVYSLLWNQPSLYPSPLSYSLRHANPLVRKGGQAEVKTATVGLPLFCTDSEGEGEEEGEHSSSEIREVSPCVVQRVTPWSVHGKRTVYHISPSAEADIATRVRSVLGYEFPPVMSRMVEDCVRRKWLNWKERGIVGAKSVEEEEKVYHQLMVDTLVFMASEVERRLLLVDSDTCDSDEGEGDVQSSQPPSLPPTFLSPGSQVSSSSATSSSDEDVPQSKRAAVKRRKRKRPWNKALPQRKGVIRSQRHETVCQRIRQQIEEARTSSSSGSEESGQAEGERG